MTKEEKIQEVWIKFPESKFNSNNGWAISYCINGISDISDNPYNEIEWMHLEADLIKWRPKELKGIENNNGWIKLKGIANEIEDRCSIWIETKNGDIEYLKENEFVPIGYAVAYQKVEKPQPRIY